MSGKAYGSESSFRFPREFQGNRRGPLQTSETAQMMYCGTYNLIV